MNKKYLIRYLDSYRIIRVAFFGTFSGVNNAATIMEKLAEAVEEYNCTRFLFDMRNTQVADSYAELFHLGIHASVLGFKKEYKAAVLFSQDEKKHRVVERVMQDRSFQLQVFQNENAALIWLNQASGKGTDT